jgi:hypothetical protein
MDAYTYAADDGCLPEACQSFAHYWTTNTDEQTMEEAYRSWMAGYEAYGDYLAGNPR